MSSLKALLPRSNKIEKPVADKATETVEEKAVRREATAIYMSMMR